jgi:hypothetical protein
MSRLSRFQLDLTTEESESIERWSAMAGIRTKKEFLLNAFTLFQWAAKQVMLGRTICAMNEATGEVRQLEMPALAAIAEYGAPPPLTPEERRRRIAEPGFPLSENDFRIGVARDGEADRSLDAESKNGSAAHLREESQLSRGTASDPAEA